MKIHTPTDYENYIPVGDKILLVLDQEDPNAMENVGGVLAPKDFALKQSPLRETVVTSVGPLCKQVKAGDTVLWNKGNSRQPFPFGVKDLHFLEEHLVICVTKKAEKPLSFESVRELIDEEKKKIENGFPYPVDSAL